MPVTSTQPTNNVFDDDDDEGWQDMPIVREDTSTSGLDEEDQKKYHYVPPAKGGSTTNATGNLLDIDDWGNDWRSKVDQNESEYTRLRVSEEDEADEVHLRTKYLFDEDKAMTPLSQMQATKNLLTEAQRIAYVGLCALTSREMAQELKRVNRKELKASVGNLELWALKIMGRLYYHMELETAEQKMIESLADHGVQAMDLVPALMTTRTVANPEYDPEEARRQAEDTQRRAAEEDGESTSDKTLVEEPSPTTPTPSKANGTPHHSHALSTSSTKTSSPPAPYQTTTRVLNDTSTSTIPGVSTSLSAADEKVTLDIRWTVLCDLFLILIADSVYDARSRVLLERVASKLGLGWLDVVKFESRVTEALEIQEDVETMENKDVIEGQRKAARKRRYMMLGLATLGGGLVIGLSAGLLAPVIGAGLGAAFTTIGISGTTGFLAGVGGTAVITTGGVLTGSGIAVHGMAKRTQYVRTFDILPLHNNKRVNCILTVPGFMNGIHDDVRLPFSVLDPIVGDVFSVLWEPEMIRETGSALKILTGEVLSQIGMTVLQATVMSALMSALQWPIILTKLGYLIDNPWNNALDRARGAGRVLADVLIHRHLGVRPITLIGFSLGSRVIFYALLELAKQKAFGIVQDVFLLGATVTASTRTWCEVRSVVSGRFVNAFARNDWVLNYLFRATSGGIGTVAGLRPVQEVPGLENVDVTDKIAGHMSYRTFMPLILDQLGFPVSSDYFDEPEEPEFSEDRIVEKEEDEVKKKGWFSRKRKSTMPQKPVSRPPSAATFGKLTPTRKSTSSEDGLPPREPSSGPSTPTKAEHVPGSGSPTPPNEPGTPSHLPVRAGFDFDAIRAMLKDSEHEVELGKVPATERLDTVRPVDLETPHINRVEMVTSEHHATSETRSAIPPAQPSQSSSTATSEHLSNTLSSALSLGDERDDDDDSDEERAYQSHIGPSYGDASVVTTPRPPSGNFSSSTSTMTGLNYAATWNSSNASNLHSFDNNIYDFNKSLTSPSFAYPSSSLSTSTFPSYPPSDGGLSFGGVDGSITVPNPDPWQVPAELGKKKAADVLNSNPWS